MMSVYSAVRERYGCREAAGQAPTWTANDLRSTALVDLGCAAIGVFAAGQIRLANYVLVTSHVEPGAANSLANYAVAGRRI
jgi:hypothetical protein